MCSPSRPAVLEAVAGHDFGQSWSLASRSQSCEPPPHHIPAQHEPTNSASVSQASLSDLETEDQTNTKPDHSPSLSECDPASSLGHTDSLFISDTLPQVHTDHECQDSFDDDDSMSEGSSGTAVMVGHPCSDEEDTAERRWRRAEQRGNDIRRASAPPCPRAVGTEGYLKVLVVSVPLSLRCSMLHHDCFNQVIIFACGPVQHIRWWQQQPCSCTAVLTDLMTCHEVACPCLLCCCFSSP